MNRGRRTFYILGAVTLLLPGGLSLFASPHPDGLERVARDAGFHEKETVHWVYALLPDYTITWMNDHWFGRAIAGVFGVVVMFSLLWLLGKWMVSRKKTGGGDEQ